MAELSNPSESLEARKTNGDVDFDDVCERCRNIPWHEVFRPENPVSTTPRESGCRVCRWFAKFGCTYTLGDRDGGLYLSPVIKRLQVQQNEDSGPRGLWNIVVSDRATQTMLQSLTPPFVSFSRVKDHFNTCVDQHADCSLPRGDHVIPNLRVINCATREVVNAPANCEYVALSYVWGSVQSDNDDLTSMRILPRVIEQSLIVASELGFKFLWIDRYCIDQRNEQHKKNQILQMSTIYREAQLTIIAAAGQDPTHGLPGVEPYRRPPNHSYHEAVGSICLSALHGSILDGIAYFRDIGHAVWASRAWTFQEAMFSRRRLVFTESQVIFICDTSTRCEWGRELTIDDPELGWLQWCMTRKPVREGSPMLRASRIMKEYCERKLTYDSDALNAIASTLNFIQKSDEYHIWGVPFRVCETSSDERQQAISIPSDSAALLDLSDVQMVQIHLKWYRWQPQRRRQGFPSWSPLGWSPEEMNFCDTYQGYVFVDTPRGKESLTTALQCAKVDPAGMAQHISLLLKTRFVSVCKHNRSYGIGSEDAVLIPLGQGFAHMCNIYWDGPVEVECETKIAIFSFDDGVEIMVLQAHDGYYERVGWSTLLADTLRNGAMSSQIWCLTDEKFAPISLTVDGKLDPLDEERLRHAFGDIDKVGLWYEQGGFHEEYITLG